MGATGVQHHVCNPHFAQHQLQTTGTLGLCNMCRSGRLCNPSQLPTAAPEHAPRCHPRVKPKRAPNKGGLL